MNNWELASPHQFHPFQLLLCSLPKHTQTTQAQKENAKHGGKD